MSFKKKKVICIIAILVAIPFAFMYAMANNIMFGAFWGLVLCIGIDGLICSGNNISNTHLKI